MERADVMIIRMISPTAMLTICRLIDCRIIVAQVNATLTASRALAPARSYIQEPVRRGSISSPSVIHSRQNDFALEFSDRTHNGDQQPAWVLVVSTAVSRMTRSWRRSTGQALR